MNCKNDNGGTRIDMEELRQEIWEMPILDSHEHIGSIPSTGGAAGIPGFNEDVYPGFEPGPTTIFDLILSPYLGGLLNSLGFKMPMTHTRDTAGQQEQLWKALIPFLNKARGTGLYMALDKAFDGLYGASLGDILNGSRDWKALSRAVEYNYQRGLYKWSGEIFKRLKIQYAIKPVHLPYIGAMGKQDNNDSYILEQNLFLPVFRVDDLLGYPDQASICGWKHLTGLMDIEVHEIRDLDDMVSKAFIMLKENNIRAIKQLQAYTRPLRFKKVERDRAASALKRTLGNGDPMSKIEVQDYIMGLILERANKTKLPFQVHSGMANLPDSNPVLLRDSIERYPEVNFILLHCYPYLSEAAFLARSYRNVYLDTAWLALQSPALLYKALDEWIGFVPYSKICLSGDATSVEECYGAMEMTREALSCVLHNKIRKGELDRELAFMIARSLLHDNAAALYAAG
ncbi:MAG: amidohydrolase family protein [Clostridiales bacterium]|nr:amidohydrolase family protein [Clostridiales bacterium]